jgi:hypothetical protein
LVGLFCEFVTFGPRGSVTLRSPERRRAAFRARGSFLTSRFMSACGFSKRPARSTTSGRAPDRIRPPVLRSLALLRNSGSGGLGAGWAVRRGSPGWRSGSGGEPVVGVVWHVGQQFRVQGRQREGGPAQVLAMLAEYQAGASTTDLAKLLRRAPGHHPQESQAGRVERTPPPTLRRRDRRGGQPLPSRRFARVAVSPGWVVLTASPHVCGRWSTGDRGHRLTQKGPAPEGPGGVLQA